MLARVDNYKQLFHGVCFRSFATIQRMPTIRTVHGLKPVDPDPAKPKRPQTAYIRFALATQAKLGFTGTQANVATNGKLIGEMWRKLPESKRKPYYDAHSTDFKLYRAAFSEYQSSGAELRWRRPEGMPKRPMTGMLRFYVEYRKQNKEVAKTYSITEFTKVAVAVWKNLKPGEQKVFNDIHKKEYAEYKIKYQEWKASGALQVWKEKVGIARVERQRKAKEDRKMAVAREQNEKLKIQKERSTQRLRKRREKEKEKVRRSRSRIRNYATAARERVMKKVKHLETRIKNKRFVMYQKYQRDLQVAQERYWARRAGLKGLEEKVKKLRKDANDAYNAAKLEGTQHGIGRSRTNT